jgi:hypothetical protein
MLLPLLGLEHQLLQMHLFELMPPQLVLLVLLQQEVLQLLQLLLFLVLVF